MKNSNSQSAGSSFLGEITSIFGGVINEVGAIAGAGFNSSSTSSGKSSGGGRHNSPGSCKCNK